MLHTFARSENHMKNLIKGNFGVKEGAIISARGIFKTYVVKIENIKNNKFDVFITQGLIRISSFNHRNYKSEDIDSLSKFGFSFSSLTSIKEMQRLIDSTFVIFDDDIHEKYDAFLDNNKKALNGIQGRYSVGHMCHEMLHLLIFSYTSDTPNLFAWAIKEYYEYGCRFNVLQHVFHFTKKYPQSVGKVNKGTITAYGKDWMSLRYEINNLILLKRANTVINNFNTAQKKLLKKLELTNDTVVLLNRFYRLSKQKKTNFIQRMSDIEDVNDILRQMETLTNKHFDWNRESLLHFLENNEYCKYDIVFDNKSDLLVIKTLNYETVKYLAKATNWCIAKNKKYWNQYNHGEDGETSQYILFDFSVIEDSKFSIIGITVTKTQRVSAAHSFNNDNMLGKHSRNDFVTIKSFLPSLSNIYGYLEYKQIPLSIFGDKERIRNAEWSQKAFFKNLEGIGLSYDDIDIRYTDERGIMVVTINVSDSVVLEKVCGKTNARNILEHLSCRLSVDSRLLILCDFSKAHTVASRMYMALINEDKISHTDTNYGVLFDATYRSIDASVEKLFEAFNVPFDVIKHPNDDLSRFMAAIHNFNFKAIKYYLDEKNMLKELNNQTPEMRDIKNEIRNEIIISMLEYFSLDFVNFIYDNGYKFRDFMSVQDVIYVLENLYNTFANNFNSRYPIKEEMFKSILKGNTHNYDNHKIVAIVSFFTFKRILEEEKCSELGFELINKFNKFSCSLFSINEVLFFHIVSTYDINSCNMPSMIQKFIRTVTECMIPTSERIRDYMHENFKEYIKLSEHEVHRLSF